ncbi:hypothetical protein LSH36_201g03035 [Paralvinella palmiformis]|uniref:ORC1/DEAH AAA+ ATPase domain-containing protein n=1 Tax=Paralvinella palmiformis TaxID=53620 RepID=A0AAD9JPF2_9ANNE|nr:hypothetical protein LSH36_201g03035 [Paralvinella palmiformis]
MSIRAQVMNLLRSGAALTAASSILTTGAYIAYKDHNRFLRMQETFARGNILAPLAENEHEIRYCNRWDVEAKLDTVLASRFTNEYYLVSGEVGSGKTRTIVELVRRMMKERGSENGGAPVYVLVTQGKSFAETLARAVSFYFDEHISFRFFIDFVLRINAFPEKDEHHKLLRVLDAVENAAFGYMKRTGRPAVLVIDGVNCLPRKVVLEKLQEKAKLWADTNIVKMVFVGNDESTEAVLQEHASNWSRAAPPVHVCDMSKEEAIRFLRDPQLLESDEATDAGDGAMSVDDAERVYQLVGGRVQLMIAFKRDHRLGLPFQSTADELIFKEREKFMDVCKSSVILRLVNMVKKSGADGIPLYKLIDASSENHVATMLRWNVIRIERKGTGMVAVFESRLTENVVAAMPLWK